MRSQVSVLYEGTWADRVAKMPDKQVAVIYQRHIAQLQARKKN